MHLELAAHSADWDLGKEHYQKIRERTGRAFVQEGYCQCWPAYIHYVLQRLGKIDGRTQKDVAKWLGTVVSEGDGGGTDTRKIKARLNEIGVGCEEKEDCNKEDLERYLINAQTYGNAWIFVSILDKRDEEPDEHVIMPMKIINNKFLYFDDSDSRIGGPQLTPLTCFLDCWHDDLEHSQVKGWVMVVAESQSIVEKIFVRPDGFEPPS